MKMLLNFTVDIQKHLCNGHFPGLPGWAGTRKVKPVWISLKQETASGRSISWAICKSASRCRQITMPVPHHSSILQAGCPSCRPANSVKALKAKFYSNFTVDMRNYFHHQCWILFKDSVHLSVFLLVLLALPTYYSKQGLCNGTVSICLSGPTVENPLLQVCCCGPGGHEILIDCCTAGSQRQQHGMLRVNAGSVMFSAYTGN